MRDPSYVATTPNYNVYESVVYANVAFGTHKLDLLTEVSGPGSAVYTLTCLVIS